MQQGDAHYGHGSSTVQVPSRPYFAQGGWDPSLGGGRAARNVQSISGHDRHKYFKRPLMPYMKIDPQAQAVHVSEASAQRLAFLREQVMAQEEPSSKDAVTQSDYRESEAQTAPFSAEYIASDPASEILALKALSVGNGTLPAGPDEIVLIDKIRRRRQVEATGDFELLKKLELTEFAERDEAMTKALEDKLDLLRTVLVEREEEKAVAAMHRVERIRNQVRTRAEAQLKKIEESRARELRRLGKHRDLEDDQIQTQARMATSGASHRRDVIVDYANEASAVYTRKPKSHGLTNSAGVAVNLGDELQHVPIRETRKTLQPLSVTEIANEKQKVIEKSSKRKAVQETNDLKRVQLTIDLKKGLAEDPQKAGKPDILALYKATPRVVRPSTPTLEDETNDDEELAIILIQRLIRGRAAQNMMFDGKEKRLDLIQELVDVERVKAAEVVDEALERKNEIESQIQGTINRVAGHLVGDTLDFLEKEKIRREQEAVIVEFEERAKAERHRREAAEAGRRQRELEQLAKDEERFRQLEQLLYESAGDYVSALMSDTVHGMSEAIAISEVEAKRAVLDGLLAVEDSEDEAAVVQDLLATIVFPELQREIAAAASRS